VFGEVQGFLLHEKRLFQLPDEDEPVGGRNIFKVQQDALVGSAAAFPQDSLTQSGWISDEWRVAVADAKQSATGLQEKILPQQGGVLSDSISGVSQRAVITGGGLDLCG
jgi:hypothetical protein